MCKNCGCGQRKPSKYAKFIKDHYHDHDHAHSHDHEHSDHYHDPETGETVFYETKGNQGHVHEHDHVHTHEHEHH